MAVATRAKPSRGPRRFTDRELAKVGVEIVDHEQRILWCTTCNAGGWQALIAPGGGFYRRYWVCPHNGCNDPRRDD
jgi:hypothetical protein